MSRVIAKKSPPFEPTETPPPKAKETRARVTAKFLADLAEDYAQHGAGAIRILRVERPHEYIKCVAALLPRDEIEGLSEGLVINIVKFGDDSVETVFSRPSAFPRLGSDDASDS
jgi:hypothetical protein